VRPGYKQTEVGPIPDDWEERSIFDLADRRKELFDDGDWIEAEYLTDGGIRLVQTGNIGEGRFTDKESKKYISAESFTKLGCKDLQVGDILICRLAEPAGRACILPDIGEERVITSVDVTIFRPPSSTADRRYLVNAFNTRRWFQSVNERCGGTTRTRIARGELGKIKVPLPPLPEQHAIATALSDVDALLGGLDRLIAKKRDLKQGAMQQLLTGQTRLPGFHGEWEAKRLGDLAEMASGGTPVSSVPAFYGGGIPWVSIADMTRAGRVIERTEKTLTPLGLANSAAQMFAAGTVLYAMYASLGECSIAGMPVSTSQAILGIRPKHEIDNVFLYYVLTSLKTTVKSLGQQGTQSNLNKGMVQAFRFTLPSREEQVAIAAVLSDMDAELTALEARRDKFRDLKQAMMQELLTGKTRLVHSETVNV
jgi:type I restriction enzyme S subunit